MKLLRMLGAVGALALVTGLGVAQDARPAYHAPNLDSITLADLKRDIYFLASPEMRGRETLKPEARVTAGYVRTRFELAGLKPAGDDGSWFQQVQFRYRSWDGTPALTVNTSDGATKLEYAKDFIGAQGPSGNAALKGAGVVFAGYAVRDEGQKYDDLAGLDVKGKVAIVLRYAPSGWAQGGRRSPFARSGDLRVKERQLRAAGAVGILLVTGPHSVGASDNRRDLPSPTGAEMSPPLELAIGNEREAAGLPFFHLTLEAVDRMLGGEGKLAAAQAAFDQSQFDQRPVLEGITVDLEVRTKVHTQPCANVAGKIEGETDEWIIVGAHHDHLGFGWFGSRDDANRRGEIHPGADDNASGTSALMEIAEAIATSGRKPRRSFLFLTFTGEEKGLLGSRWYVRNPLVPHSKVVCMINFDMVGRLTDMALQMQGPAASKFIEKHCVEAAPLFPDLKVSMSPRPPIPASDHWPFYSEAGIPVLFPMGRMPPELHRTTDVPETIHYEGALYATRLIAEIAWRISQDPEYADYSGPVRGSIGPDGNPRAAGPAPVQPPQPERRPPAPQPPTPQKEDEFRN